ncbi:calcium-binding protein [Paenibacillus mucilaginosus]|uniref:calcium-binding protein n=1 Tax=Paenibacillus mucilaginosus TaxID=61624 RepID=UPI001EF09F43|nr:calcium-binding protein [Paenibacillus mucilaginosus]
MFRLAYKQPLFGTAGDDLIRISPEGNQYVFGRDGNDTIHALGTRGGSLIHGGSGDDLITAEGPSHRIHGGEGKDQFILFSGENIVLDNQGNDGATFIGTGTDAKIANNKVDLGIGNDYVNAYDQKRMRVNMGEGDDRSRLYSHSGSIWKGGDGDDELVIFSTTGGRYEGGAGNDHFIDWPGDEYSPPSWSEGNTYFGGQGKDIFELSGSRHTVHGGDDSDWAHGYASNSVLYGESGDDSLNTSTFRSSIYGGEGNDSLGGTTSMSSFYGGQGNDSIGTGWALHDYSIGSYMDGGTGDDRLSTAGMDSLMIGGSGNDSLMLGGNIYKSGDLNTTMIGGSGSDLYAIGPTVGKCTIQDDGLAGEVDTLNILTATYKVGETQFTREEGDLIVTLIDEVNEQHEVLVEGFFGSPASRIERFVYGEGEDSFVFTDADVERMIQAASAASASTAGEYEKVSVTGAQLQELLIGPAIG